NQYKVVMEAAPEYWQSPEALKDIYIVVPPAASAASTTTANATASPGTAASAPGASNAGAAANSTRTSAGAVTSGTGTTTPSAGAAAMNGTTNIPALVPLAAISRYGPTNTPLAVNHQGQFAASTISFNLPPDVSLSDAT